MAKVKSQESQRGMVCEVEIKHDVHISIALRLWEAGSSLKQPSRNWIQTHWVGRGTSSDQGKCCWVHWKVTGKRKSHFPRLLISVSQSTLGLNFPMWGVLWALLWRKEACSQHFLSSKGRRGKATIPWHVGSLARVPGENYIWVPLIGKGFMERPAKGGDTSDGQLRFT